MKELIIGLMRVFDFPHAKLTIDALASNVDGLFFLVDMRVTKGVLAAIESNPKTMGVFANDSEWDQAKSLAKAFDTLKRVEPSIVFYPDEDELLPDNREEAVRRLSDGGNISMSYYMLTCWGDENTVLGDWYDAPHCKALRWNKNVRFVDDKGVYFGCCCPVDYKRATSSKPMRHLMIMDEDCRARRQAHYEIMKRRHRLPVDFGPKTTIAFDPSWDNNRWLGAIPTSSAGWLKIHGL